MEPNQTPLIDGSESAVEKIDDEEITEATEDSISNNHSNSHNTNHNENFQEEERV